MRVALISPGPTTALGGVESVVWQCARELHRLGVERVEVWAHQPHAAAVTTVERDGVLLRDFPAYGPDRFPIAPALWQHVRRDAGRFDVVHSHNYHSTAGAAILAAKPGPALVLSPHFHGGGHTVLASALHHPYRLIGRRLARAADRVVAVSEAEASLLRSQFGSLVEPLTVIRDGVDTAEIAAASPWPDEPPTLLVLGRHEPYKRVELVIDAFAASRRPGQLVILGDGPQRSELQRRAAATGRGADIRFLGFRSRAEVLRWLRTARVLVNLSEHEAFGLAALEAVAGGARAVLSDIPAHRELQDNEGRGRAEVVAPDITAVRKIIERDLAAAPSDPVGVRDWSQMAADHLKLYAELAT